METATLSTINQRIRFLRKSIFGRNQRAFCAEVDLTQGALSRIENGLTMPSLDTFIIICKKFGVSADWLLFGIGEMFIADRISSDPNLRVNSLMIDLLVAKTFGLDNSAGQDLSARMTAFKKLVEEL